MAMKQYWIDVREKELRQQILQELHYYHRVRQAWGLGPLKLKRRQAILDIWAEYWDIENNRVRDCLRLRPRLRLLGQRKWASAWQQALQRVKHVKSFL